MKNPAPIEYCLKCGTLEGPGHDCLAALNKENTRLRDRVATLEFQNEGLMGRLKNRDVFIPVEEKP